LVLSASIPPAAVHVHEHARNTCIHALQKCRKSHYTLDLEQKSHPNPVNAIPVQAQWHVVFNVEPVARLSHRDNLSRQNMQHLLLKERMLKYFKAEDDGAHNLDVREAGSLSSMPNLHNASQSITLRKRSKVARKSTWSRMGASLMQNSNVSLQE
jgi:hypothetical protein